MSILDSIKWHLMTGERKLQILKNRGLIIGEGCEILNGYEFGSEPYLVEIGNHVRITSGVSIITHDGGVWVLRGMKEELKDVDRFGKVKIGNNCHIGVKATIMPGVTIGDNCIIGAGAIVTHDIPSNSVAVGIPAKAIETIDDYETKNFDSLVHTKHMSWEAKRKYITANYSF